MVLVAEEVEEEAVVPSSSGANIRCDWHTVWQSPDGAVTNDFFAVILATSHLKL